MLILDHVSRHFDERKELVLQLIYDSKVPYHEIGIFGSYARDEYRTNSDIDFCVIADTKPERHIAGALREQAEILGADIIFVTREYFHGNDSIFAQNLRRDYRRIV